MTTEVRKKLKNAFRAGRMPGAEDYSSLIDNLVLDEDLCKKLSERQNELRLGCAPEHWRLHVERDRNNTLVIEPDRDADAGESPLPTQIDLQGVVGIKARFGTHDPDEPDNCPIPTADFKPLEITGDWQRLIDLPAGGSVYEIVAQVEELTENSSLQKETTAAAKNDNTEPVQYQTAGAITRAIVANSSSGGARIFQNTAHKPPGWQHVIFKLLFLVLVAALIADLSRLVPRSWIPHDDSCELVTFDKVMNPANVQSKVDAFRATPFSKVQDCAMLVVKSAGVVFDEQPPAGTEPPAEPATLAGWHIGGYDDNNVFRQRFVPKYQEKPTKEKKGLEEKKDLYAQLMDLKKIEKGFIGIVRRALMAELGRDKKNCASKVLLAWDRNSASGEQSNSLCHLKIVIPATTPADASPVIMNQYELQFLRDNVLEPDGTYTLVRLEDPKSKNYTLSLNRGDELIKTLELKTTGEKGFFDEVAKRDSVINEFFIQLGVKDDYRPNSRHWYVWNPRDEKKLLAQWYFDENFESGVFPIDGLPQRWLAIVKQEGELFTTTIGKRALELASILRGSDHEKIASAITEELGLKYQSSILSELGRRLGRDRPMENEFGGFLVRLLILTMVLAALWYFICWAIKSRAAVAFRTVSINGKTPGKGGSIQLQVRAKVSQKRNTSKPLIRYHITKLWG